MSKSKAGRKKKYTEPSKSLRARVPESQHDILVEKINEHCKPFLNKNK